jgi:hypothetical protein
VNHKLVVAVVIAAALSAGGTTAAVVIAQSGSDAATQELDALAGKGPDTAVVAIVNGQPISRRTIDVQYAMALQPGLDDAQGRPLAGLSKDELLNREIDNLLLAQAAEKAGIVVTEDEVTLSIHSGLIDPLSSPTTDPELRKAGLAALNAAGVTLSGAATDPTVRQAYREFGLIERYAATSKDPRDVRLAAAKASAQIQTFPDVLNAAH